MDVEAFIRGERAFDQVVFMPVTRQQFNSLLKPLAELGYNTEYHDYTYSVYDPFIIIQDGKVDLTNKHDKPELSCNNSILPAYNRKMFLALAAMSHGNKLYPGECIILKKKNRFIVWRKRNFKPGTYKKAYPEHIIEHFKNK